MSKESLDYSILCPNYYTNWEEGCCMENCTHNDLDLCPIHYVKGLLEDKDQQIAELEEKLAEKDKEIKHRHWAIKSGVYIQDKISFAVEQLEKVKEKANEKQELDWGLGFRYKDHWDIVNEIDKLIAEIKGE